MDKSGCVLCDEVIPKVVMMDKGQEPAVFLVAS